MKNADMPAMPLTNGNGAPIHHSGAGMDNEGVMFGMTKREMMAMHALNGLMVAYNVEDVALGGDSIVKDAVWYADALLEELERAK